MSLNKNEFKQLNSEVQTRDLETIANKSGNLYRSLVVVSKRANQINTQIKEELHSKLKEFASHNDNLEEVFENREQIEISKHYEKLPNSTIIAANEFLNDQIYFRDISVDTNN